ncbi:MAG: SDR family NAD(P)-dependent oxidoreductase [Candidatus Hydrogenedentes bacterium]|nr:SDR family NAD(P)-dependent oxidoreductase [Candidatus Hydrogenedentota bacterium]
MDLANRTIVITGASRGLGRVLAVHFAGRAGSIVLAARDRAGLEDTAARVESAGGSCSIGVCDLARPESIEALVADVRARAGRIDVLINNAANVTSKPFLDTSLDEIGAQIGTNVAGMLQLTRLVAPVMLEQGEGMVINISSLAGYKPNTSQTVYSISKGAVNAASEALYAELKGRGIHVMNVPLPPIGTGPGQLAPERFAHRLERAIEREECELFLHRRSRFLMRLYRFLPFLARLR